MEDVSCVGASSAWAAFSMSFIELNIERNVEDQRSLSKAHNELEITAISLAHSPRYFTKVGGDKNATSGADLISRKDGTAFPNC
jgi:hypothetical protein